MDQEQATIETLPAEKIKLTGLSSPVELISKAFKIYHENFWSYIAMLFVPALGFLPLIAVLLVYVGLSLSKFNSPISNLILGILGIVALVIGIYFAIIANAGKYQQLLNFYAGKNTSVFGNIKEAKTIALKLFGVNILTAIFIMLWLILFIIPGLIFAVYYAFAAWACVSEGYGSTLAIKRSKELVKGMWWPITLRLLFLALISIVLSLPIFIFKEGSTESGLYSILNGAINIYVTPLFFIYAFLIYLELSVKKKKDTANSL